MWIEQQHINVWFIFKRRINIQLPVGPVRHLSFRCFASRAHAMVAHAAIFNVVWASQYMDDDTAKRKNEFISGNQCDHMTFVWKWSQSKQRLNLKKHISSIYSTSRCWCHTRMYTSKSRCHTFKTGVLVWAVRLWIVGCRPTIYWKCHACVLVPKNHPRSGSAVVLLDKNRPPSLKIYRNDFDEYMFFNKALFSV